MKPVDDELFAHIKNSLTEHEEAYVPGAWERFEKKEKKKTGWLWLASLSSAAAVFLIGFTLFYTGDKTQNNKGQQQLNTPLPKKDTDAKASAFPATGPITSIENLKTKLAEHKKIVSQRINNNAQNNFVNGSIKPSAKIEQVIVPMADHIISPLDSRTVNPNAVARADRRDVIVTPVNDGVADKKEVTAKADVRGKDSVKVNKALSFQEFLNAEVKSNSAVAALKSSAKKTDKWEMGLMVAPSIGNAKKLNMGYGVSMGYALSDKVSISSGISYNEMAASKSIGGTSNTMDAPSGMAMVNDTKSLKSVDANLVGIDIPLGIKYYLSKKFYTNVGVSAFAVLNQKQQNNYVQGSVEYAASDDQTNTTGFKAVFQERTVSEAVPSGEIRGDKYLGFYNVSFGFKQQISGSKAFSVEPFMKLPMKEFTKENLYLIGTGIRLKFDF